LKNFSFSILLSIFIFLLGWLFTKSEDIDVFIVYSIMASPLLVAAFGIMNRNKTKNKVYEKSNYIFSHLIGLICSALLFVLIIRSGSKYGPVQFLGNYRVGWNFKSAGELLALIIMMSSGAMTIWTGYNSGQKGRFKIGFLDKSNFKFANEISGFIFFVYLFSLSWAYSVGLISLIWKNLDLKTLSIITARAYIPMLIILIVSILRLPFMGFAWLVSLLLVAVLFQMNLGTTMMFVIMAISILAAFAILITRNILNLKRINNTGPAENTEDNIS